MCADLCSSKGLAHGTRIRVGVYKLCDSLVTCFVVIGWQIDKQAGGHDYCGNEKRNG